MPTVCSETCVGRIRYLGVMLYDADRIEEIASVNITLVVLSGTEGGIQESMIRWARLIRSLAIYSTIRCFIVVSGLIKISALVIVPAAP